MNLRSVRDQLGQASWVVKRYDRKRLQRQAGVVRRIERPRLPLRRTRRGEVWAVSVVRDEADVVGDVIAHLQRQGVDHVLVADNSSVDGTRELLHDLAARDAGVHVAHDRTTAHFQSEKMTYLAHLAWRAGADWIVPFDADEFWFAQDLPLADRLRQTLEGTGIVHARFHHMVPVSPDPDPIVEATFTLDATPSFPGKVAVRSHPLLEIWPGNHNASRVGAVADELFIAHAQYRSPVQVARKVRQGAAAARLTGHDTSWFSPHWESGSALSDEAIAEVFARISRGEPDERLGYAARGPMVQVQPLLWPTWDPDGEIPHREVARPA